MGKKWQSDWRSARNDPGCSHLTSATKLAAVGAAIGLIGILALCRVLGSFLFGVKGYDPIVLTTSVAAVMLLGLPAAAIPARRASSINPVEALRSE
jgi:putative ABC transport system permease protein